MWQRNLYVCWVAQVLSLTGFGLVLPFMPFYIQELGVTDPDDLRLWTGLLSSAPALTMAAMAPVWGMLADRSGSKLMMLRAAFSGAVVLALIAASRSVTTVFILRIVQGAFTGTVTASATLVATGTPKERLGWALGLLSSSNFIGVSLGPLVGGITSEQFGYRATFLVGSGVLLCGFFLVLLLVHEQASPAAADRAADRTAAPRELVRGQLAAILSVPVVTMLATLLVMRFVKALPVPFLPLHVQELRGQLEGSATVTGFLSASRGAATALSAVTLTRLGDRYPRMKLVGLLVAVGAVLSFPLAFLGRLWSFSVLFVLATFFLGAIEPLIQADLSARTPAHRRGLLFGVQTTVGNIGWFLAPLLGSAVAIRSGVPAVFLTTAVFLSITVALAAWINARGVYRHA